MKMIKETTPVASDLYKVTRGQVEHLNNAINQRVVWLIIAQSFFFNGYALLVTGNPETEFMKSQQALLMIIFPFASLFTVIISYADIIGSLIYLKNIRLKFEPKQEEDDILFPPAFGWNYYRVLEHASSALLPVVFIIIWIYIIIIKN